MRTVLMLTVCVAVLAAGCTVRDNPNCVVPAEEPAGPVIRLTTTYPGANAKVVADTVAAPLEQQVNGVEGLVLIESESRDDGSYVTTLRFAPKTDVNEARVLVQKRLAVAEPQLPEEARRLGITVSRGDPDQFPPLWVALTSPDNTYDALFLSNYATLKVRDELTRVPGVTDVRLVGPTGAAMRVWLDPERLAARSLTTQDVVAALQRQSVEVGAAGGPKNMALAVRTKVADPEKLEGVILKTGGGGRVVYLRDVARVELGTQTTGFARVDDRPAALVAVIPADDKARDAAVEQATREFAKLPKGIAGDVVADVTNGKWSLVELHIPDGASRERREKLAAEAVKRVRALEGSPRCLAFAEEHANVVRMLVKVAAKDGAELRKALAGVEDVRVRVSDLAARRPFPVRIALTDEGGHGTEKLREWGVAVARRLEKDGVAIDPDVFPGSPVPQTNVRVDREKAEKMGIAMRDVANAIQTHSGGTRVYDFNKFGRTWEVIVQTDEKWNTPEELKKLTLRTAEGRLVPLGVVAEFRKLEAPPAALRVNLHPAIRITADAPQRKTVEEVAAKCAEAAEAVRKELKLPDAFKVVNLVK